MEAAFVGRLKPRHVPITNTFPGFAQNRGRDNSSGGDGKIKRMEVAPVFREVAKGGTAARTQKRIKFFGG